ncbi:hypothetical protein F0562_020787 [Nyssa sinensis]|uniref:MATH domain-containing protein n=1 Tax=Nyssa sinensis TaxID=561372 RepID=A0A5J5BW07_9ASTE|nr:hypothetical protein F0562_020787 [Nyssa sinensis]
MKEEENFTMKRKSCFPVGNNGIDDDVSRSFRKVQPAHYIFKIESFSTLWETNTEKYESDEFESGGYKWKLCLYPNGNTKRNVNDHISLSLLISDTKDFPLVWELNVEFKLFIFNHIKGEYLTVQDGDGRISRFHGMKTELGFDQFLSLETFKDSSHGFLVDDCCLFGAEVFVIKYTGRGECLSMIKEPKANFHTWKVQNFSTITEASVSSEVFKIGERKWALCLYPKGNDNGKSSSLSLCLKVFDCAKLGRLYAKFKLVIRDQLQSKHVEKQGARWYSASAYNWGYSSFMLLNDLNDKSKGFIVNDTLIVEVEILVMSVIKNFT